MAETQQRLDGLWKALSQFIADESRWSCRLLMRVLGSDQVLLEPLKKDEEEEEPIYVQDDSAGSDKVSASDLLRTLQEYEYEYSQRQAKEDNPHGEHAEDVFKILQPLNWSQ